MRIRDAAWPAAVTTAAVLVAAPGLADADWGQSIGPAFFTVVAGCSAALVVALDVVLRRPGGATWHVAVPLLLIPVAPLGTAACGPAREPWVVAACWAAAAATAHVAIATARRPAAPAAGGRRWFRTVAAAASLLAVVTVGLAIQRAGQITWRANDFRAVGVPLLIPEVPGFHPTRAGAGRSSVQVVLSERAFPDEHLGRTFTATIGRTTAVPGADAVALPTGDPRYVVVLMSQPIYPSATATTAVDWSLRPLVPLVRLRPATGDELARLPWASRWEPD